MTTIYTDMRDLSCKAEDIASAASDGFVFSAAQADAEFLRQCIQQGVKTTVLVSKGDDQIVSQLCAAQSDEVSFVCDAGLTETNRLRALAPNARWIAKTDVYKVEASYSFGNDEYDSGFKTYKLNPATVDERRVSDSNLLLDDWLDRAKHLNIDLVWLESSEAREVGKGFDLIAARRAAKAMNGGVLISGGATNEKHVRNLANECMVSGVVLDKCLIDEAGISALRGIWRPEEDRTDDALPSGNVDMANAGAQAATGIV